MTEAERVPGNGWYGLAGAIALATTVAAGGIGVWLFLEYETAVQFLAPGRHTVELKKPGSYLVWNDYRTVFQGRSYDEAKHLPTGARISVIDKTSGRELPVGSQSGATSTTGNTESVAVAQFSIAQPGPYDIVVQGSFPPRVMSVGRNFIFQLAGGLFGAFALVFAGYSAALGIAGWVFLKREEAARIAVRARAGTAGPAVAGPAAQPGEQSLKRLTAVVYGLQIAAFLVGITFIAAIIINTLKRKEVEGTWLESHFRWQIRTFWYGLLWSVIGFVLVFIIIGFFVLMAAAAWVLYRAIRGWIQLEDGKPMYA
jgi:uncharacterized membrane protein